ncbi:HTH-type transcriptional regulator / antitoxin HipB [Burkholderia multivorans]
MRAVNLIVNTPAQLGEILSSARQARGMTQAEAAARIGIGQPRLSLLETTSTASLSLSQLLALTALYGLELSVRTKGERSADEAEW